MKLRDVIITQTNGERRHIGTVCTERNRIIFKMKRNFKKHFYRNLKAWGIDRGVFETYGTKVDAWIIIDIPTGTRYEVASSTIAEHGKLLTFGDHLSQYFLPIKYWSVFNPEQKEMFR